MRDPRFPPSFKAAAVVLAAGLSSRMDGFKPLLPFGDTTVLGHVIASLRSAGLDLIHVVTGHRAAEMTPVLERFGVVDVANPDFERGMYSSVQRGIASLPETVDGCLLLPVDIPLLRPATLARIVAAAKDCDALVVHPTFRGTRGHPPFLRRALFDEIRNGSGEGGGLRAVLEAHAAEASDIAVFDRGCLKDMDRPADHQDLCAALARHRVPDDEECEAVLDVAAVVEPIRRHCRAVADLATAIAERLAEAGLALDVDLVRAAARVHDISKGRPRHAEIGAAMLLEYGFPDVATIVASHMAITFDGTAIDESAVVYLADKLVCGERRVPLAERFAPSLHRFRDQPAALTGARQRLADAEAILSAVERHIGRLEMEFPPTRTGRAGATAGDLRDE